MQVTTYLRSKVARRVVLLFILCSLLPVSALGVIAYSHVTAHLSDQSYARLRQTSKAVGMAIYERLMLLEAEMHVLLAHQGRSEAASKGGEGLTLGPTFGNRYKGVAIKSGDSTDVLFGQLATVPEASPSLHRHLRDGKASLAITEDAAHQAHLFISLALDSERPEQGILQAEINGAYLWFGGEGIALPGGQELCVFDLRGLSLFCSADQRDALIAEVKTRQGQSAAASFEWKNGQEGYLAGSWSIPLKFQFGEAHWTVVVSEAKSSAFAPLESFRQTFALIVLLTLCVVTLFSVSQIRSRLGPLEELEQGTKRIAERDFSSRVAVESDDEFGMLGRSFNTMADQLGRQFQMLETIAAIGQAILSSYGTDETAKVVLARAPEALHCDALGIALFEVDQEAEGFLHARYLSGESTTSRYPLKLSEADRAALLTHPHHAMGGKRLSSGFLLDFVRKELATALVFPVVADGVCVGILVLGYQSGHDPSGEDIGHGKKLADQVSVAIANARETARRTQADAKAHYLANYDPLTRLPNRTLFYQCIADTLAGGTSPCRGAVLLVNLDRFQRVNDTFGPKAGDRLLENMAARIDACVRKDRSRQEQVSVARLGSDQFGVLLTHVTGDADSTKVGQAILSTIREPFQVGDSRVYLTASVGVALLQTDGTDADLLIRNADTAMRSAKEEGGNQCRFYSESMNRILAARLTLEADLRAAIEGTGLLLYYQPQVDIASGSIVGAEALVRWQDPIRGLVPPDEFIPIAEEDESLIVSLGEWVIRAACMQQQEWRRRGLPPFDIAVNVSAVHFRHPDFFSRLEEILQQTGADRRYLELELTETVLMNDTQGAVSALKRVREMGIRVAMDDFGTGYSSLAYLRQFPVDKLKVDRAFVKGIGDGSDAAAIASAIVAMGRAMNLHVLAEGVETPAQLAFLRDRGCHTYQGYLFSRPLSSENATALFRKHLSPPLAQSA